MPFTKLI